MTTQPTTLRSAAKPPALRLIHDADAHSSTDGLAPALEPRARFSLTAVDQKAGGTVRGNAWQALITGIPTGHVVRIAHQFGVPASPGLGVEVTWLAIGW